MTIENGALKNVSAGSTVADLKEQLYAEVGEITFLNDGSVLADADEVTNGTQIQLSVEGTIVDALNIALKEESVPEASEAAMQALRNMVDKAIAMGSDDAALNAAIANAQAVLAKEAPTVTEVVTALLDLSEAMTKAAQELWEIVTKAELEGRSSSVRNLLKASLPPPCGIASMECRRYRVRPAHSRCAGFPARADRSTRASPSRGNSRN